MGKNSIRWDFDPKYMGRMLREAKSLDKKPALLYIHVFIEITSRFESESTHKLNI